LQSDDYRAITVQEACNAIASREGGPDASVAAAHARLASGDPSAPRPPRASKKGCCFDARQLNVDEFLPHLRSLSWYEDQIAHVEAVPERPAQYMRLSTPISGATERALLSRSLHRLYTHQVRAVEAALEGKNVAVAASTASGKSLCYNIPIMEAIAQDAKACAIYIFPTKALAQDQMGAVRRLLEAGFANMAPVVEVYDGDTAPGERDRIRDTAQLVITNPDMLHCSILPVHQQFARILANLRSASSNPLAPPGSLPCSQHPTSDGISWEKLVWRKRQQDQTAPALSAIISLPQLMLHCGFWCRTDR